MTQAIGFKHVTGEAAAKAIEVLDSLGTPGIIQGCYTELEQVLIPGFKFNNYPDEDTAVEAQDELVDATLMLMTAYFANAQTISYKYGYYCHTCKIYGATRIFEGLPQLNG